MKIFIDGAAGTTGLEIADRLEGRGEFDLIRVDETQRKDANARADALNAADIAILCLPDDAACEAVGLIENDTTRVIDASSAHRIADGWTYGFPELTGREVVANARFVSNPGCYPTGFLALIAPLVRADLLPADWPYTVNAVSGYSGGGKALIERFGSAEAADTSGIAWRGYSLTMDHKHGPEMQAHAQLVHPPLFAPAVIGGFRGMAVEIPVPLASMPSGRSPDAMRDALTDFYRDSTLVTVCQDNPAELLIERRAAPSDRLDLFVTASADTSQMRLIATLDNLGKGAGGAAVQNLNLMAGLPETAGLRL